MSHKCIAPSIGLCCAALLALGSISTANAASFLETFDDGSASTRFTTGSINTPAIDYAFDYSTIGIPSAPNSTGGSTTGLRMASRTTTADSAGAVSATRIGPAMTGNYVMTFDMWINYNGGAGGGGGSTEMTFWGLNNGPSGILSGQFAGGTADGYAFTATGEGGAGGDYRVYYTDPSDDGSQYPKANAVWAAGGNTPDSDGNEPDNNLHDYYDGVMNDTTPAGAGIFSSPPYETAGAPSKQWVQVEVEQVGNTVSTSINGFLISTLTLAELADGNGSAYLSYADIFTGSVPDDLPEAYVLFDNLRVVPEPSAIALCVLGVISLLGWSRRR